jgi:cyanobactin maturation PatA/PatG family protease
LGRIGYDLISEARRDSIQQHMDGANPDPLDATQMLSYLKARDGEAASILWTLNCDQMPLYAIMPAGPFAARVHEILRDFLSEQVANEVELVSIPGRLAGQARLFNGQIVPVVIPEPRGMYSWTTGALVQAVVGKSPPASAPAGQHDAHARKAQGVRGFLQKVYHELRNLGLTAEERAINYAATNAYQIEHVFEAALKESMELDAIEVERSPICRVDSDCWDVKIHFFYPERQVQTVRRVFRFMVDVSDIVPVTVGPMRSWFVR